jgi:hypothetical protein
MKKSFYIKNPAIKNIITAIAIAFFGFILLNVTFIIYSLFQGFILRILMFFIPINMMNNSFFWFPILIRGIFIVLVLLISFYIFKSKLSDFYKSTYMIVPIAIVLVIIGMYLNRWPIFVYLFGGIIVIFLLYYFYFTRKSWMYHCSVILVSFVLAVYTIFGGQI